MVQPLRIDMSQTFGYPLALELTPWSEGVSWINDISNQRFVNAYHEDKGLSLAWLFNTPEGTHWHAQFPSELADALLAFETRFRQHTFSSLWFVSRSKAAQELLVSAPLLVWFIMEHAKQACLTPDDVFPLFGLKRTQILALHNLPASPAVLKLLNKYQATDFNQQDIHLIRELYARFDARLLSRFQRLHRDLAIWLIDQPDIMDYPFIYDLDDTDILSIRTTLRDTLAMAGQAEQPQARRQLQNCRQLDGLHALHDRLVTHYNRLQRAKHKNTLFPACRLSGSDTIVPISNTYDLLQEGSDMKHCIGSYNPRVLRGEYFVFKVLAPERATLGLHYVRGELKVDQLRLKRNATPTKETQEAVYWWLTNQEK
ncbi:PcfJ domain-containing protein [Thiomicrospira cyclica]|uniref:PcfJ-like protein n=1 Tax=Thiomicrospira cyclica (strain DSM 14477 / JCM 11371 / ALM1) TaxID=717773 RepID=F6DBS0_THICA|nr:PcfJ domain-containing protein [Thiomicrospira cyclica]AEG31306.1 hypothetical protein Thicy_0533 [Thiomicrospira cyclica ALM1]